MAARDRHGKLLLLGGIAFLLLMAISSASVAGHVTGSYQYSLSGFSGPIRYSWARPFVDLSTGEIYVVEGNSVRVFNPSGMEIYSFGDGGELGLIADITVDSEGNVFTLSYRSRDYFIGSCDFRGELRSEVRIAKLPEEFSDFSPSRMFYREGAFFLVDKGRLRVAVVDKDGAFRKGYDLAALIGMDDKDRADNDIYGFNMDRAGNMLFTIPVQFKAYRITPEGKVTSFGQRGSSPGRFGVAAGIAADGKGNYLVSDTLRCVVMIFDKDFRFQSEFGQRGFNPGNLIGPRDLEVDGNNRVFVTQLRKRGISVFLLSEN